ncbi:MAG: AAA family ATPase, partial [Desulfobacterales bacterium]|nr:AAA family ATPase [Desulfobacterales bacterium]
MTATPSTYSDNSDGNRETLIAVVDRVTYHNPDNGWSVIKVLPLGSNLFSGNKSNRLAVVVHQTQVFAGATMEFQGQWTQHPKFGRQFKAVRAMERKPATASALEKYIGSGLIKGIGPKTAKKIVGHFKADTLEVFENQMDRLTEVPGIAKKKLEMISTAWTEHRAIRDVMMFLQSHGLSTLFAVRIYKEYGDEAIAKVTANPYQLANDFYGFGFFSADKVALSIGFAEDSAERLMAGIAHVLSAARNFGHCYLTFNQILSQVEELLSLELGEPLPKLLDRMEEERMLMKRMLVQEEGGDAQACYYSRTLYFDEAYVARRVREMDPGSNSTKADPLRISRWVDLYCKARKLTLSEEQAGAVKGIACENVSILTGGPGCGKTTTTKVLVALLEAMGLKVMLAAPTGRAAQRMGEVIGREAKTIHRLLGWKGGKFKKNQDDPLDTDFLVVDECSMLDINLSASLFKAVPHHGQLVLIGDFDQLPSVGAGNVLKDMIASGQVPCYRLTQIFRQAAQSLIIKYAHQINQGQTPWIQSPFKNPKVWKDPTDCLFLDSDEATQEQMNFISRVKRVLADQGETLGPEDVPATDAGLFEFRSQEKLSPFQGEISIPDKFRHVDLERVARSQGPVAELKSVVKKVHPWSSLHYNLTAVDTVSKLYTQWIPRYYGKSAEIQILSPMTRGSLGTINLNRVIQERTNPPAQGKPQVQVGSRIFRVGDRVIHRKNNYDLGVFNGDIGVIRDMDTQALTLTISFFPDHRYVVYRQADLVELDLAYAVTIHKSQGSEF